MFKRDPLLLFIGSVALFFFSVVMIYKETHPAWRQYQARFAKTAADTIGAGKAQNMDTGILQLYIPSLNRVDRCITCHQGYNIPGMEGAQEPFTTHPDLPFMKYHTFSRFGCTVCHGGQGYATTVKDAHGLVRHWDEPLLDRALGEKYGLEHPGHIMEINCNTCHRDNGGVAWMDYINQAKALVKKDNCRACHIIDGSGGNVGPDLTFEGDKNPELFVFTNIKQGPKTAFNWLFRHFKDPAAVTKGTAMPNFGFTDEQARALTMLVLSWRQVKLPYEYIPKAGTSQTAQSVPGAGPAHKAAKAPASAEKGKEVFTTKGCTACHTIGKGKLVGPDLKGVTRIRTAAWLKDWLKDTVKMQATDPTAKELLKEYIVPMPQPSLTDREIDDVILYLGTAGGTK